MRAREIVLRSGRLSREVMHQSCKSIPSQGKRLWASLSKIHYSRKNVRIQLSKDEQKGGSVLDVEIVRLFNFFHSMRFGNRKAEAGIVISIHEADTRDASVAAPLAWSGSSSSCFRCISPGKQASVQPEKYPFLLYDLFGLYLSRFKSHSTENLTVLTVISHSNLSL